jgi:hypothetical protein
MVFLFLAKNLIMEITQAVSTNNLELLILILTVSKVSLYSKGFCLRFMGIQSCERSYTDHNKKGKGKLSVELNSSYSIDEVNVRFKTQNILDKDLMVISLETPVHPLEISSAAEAELQICQYSWIVFCIRSRKYLLRYYEKKAQIILVLLIMMGSLVLDTQPEPFIKRRWREWKFYLGLGNVKQEGVVKQYLRKNQY